MGMIIQAVENVILDVERVTIEKIGRDVTTPNQGCSAVEIKLKGPKILD